MQDRETYQSSLHQVQQRVQLLALLNPLMEHFKRMLSKMMPLKPPKPPKPPKPHDAGAFQSDSFQDSFQI